MDIFLTLHSRTNESKVVFKVSTEEHNFVSRNISTGKYSKPFRGDSEVEISSHMVYGPTQARKQGDYRQIALGTCIR